jgi:ketosteroid isomerase-like protein
MQAFRDAIESRDLEGLVALFTDDIVFRSPAVHAPYQGRDQAKAIFAAVGEVMEDFRFSRQIGASDAADHALVFRARVGDREVEGCDFIHVNEDGLIDELFVMVRPLTGVMALAEAMKRELGVDESGQQSERRAAEGSR